MAERLAASGVGYAEGPVERPWNTREIVDIPGDALIRHTVTMPDDGLLDGRAAEKVILDDLVLSTIQVSRPNVAARRWGD